MKQRQVRPVTTREQFLLNPEKHRTLGAFHVYQELLDVNLRLVGERRRRCAEVVGLFPYKVIVSEGDATVTLGQVESFKVMGMLQEEEMRDLQAATTFLTALVAMLGEIMDVTLPFPCLVGRPRRCTPCALHPFTDHWFHFGIDRTSCFSGPDFAVALRFVNEDVRRLCACQGVVVPAHLGTLQLLAHYLSAVAGSRGEGEFVVPVRSQDVLERFFESGDWTVVELSPRYRLPQRGPWS